MKVYVIAAAILISTNIFAGLVHSVDKQGNKKRYSNKELKKNYGGSYNQHALQQFERYATATNGALGYSPDFKNLPEVIDTIFEEIVRDHPHTIDIAIVLDTTGSMHGEIESVKDNLIRLVKKFRHRSLDNTIDIALILYRDRDDLFTTKVVQDFTIDLNTINSALKIITVDGGGDEAEAVLDALETAAFTLNWRSDASRNILLIGDAPGHDHSTKSSKAADEILGQLKDLELLVFAILASDRHHQTYKTKSIGKWVSMKK